MLATAVTIAVFPLNRVVLVHAVTPASRSAAACCDSEIVRLAISCGCAVMDD